MNNYVCMILQIHLILFDSDLCGCVCMCVCYNSAISHNNFVKCGPIVTQLFTEVAGYDICIVNTYHGNKSEVKVNVTESVNSVKNT